MKRWLMLLLAGSVLSFTSHSDGLPASQAVLILGQVTDAATGKPIPDVQVVLLQERIGTLSSQEGLFRLQAAWRHNKPLLVSFRHLCYHTVYLEVELNPQARWRRLQVGMPFDHEKWVPFSPPLGACPPPEGPGGEAF